MSIVSNKLIADYQYSDNNYNKRDYLCDNVNLQISSRQTKDIEYSCINGFLALVIFLTLAIIGALLPLFIEKDDRKKYIYLLIPIFFFVFTINGYVIISPNSAAVITFCGKYIGTIKKNGFFWILPYYFKHKISTKLKNFNSKLLKVNDKSGNPILIAAIVCYRIIEPSKAYLDVENLDNFIDIQTEAALRRVAYTYNYDRRDSNEINIKNNSINNNERKYNNNDKCLKDGDQTVNIFLKKEIQSHLYVAGIEICSAEISNLSYAPEIANAMLRRQQAEAVISARKTIIEGAVGICGMAVSSLKSKGIVELNENEKSKLISNLLVVLCSESNVHPTINTGD